jgi:1-acyl-sn-glycerol-3-phosphate acyltransferase
MGYYFARLIIRLMFALIARIHVHGMENVPSSGGYIAASNHIGRLDAPLVYYLLDRKDVVMLVAEKYQRYAIYRWFVRRLDAIWVDRFNADLGALRAALNRLKQGAVLVLAPEGTRSRDGKLQPARAGASYLAAKSGVQVVPVAVVGTQDREVMARLRRLGRLDINISIGKPFTLPALKGRDREAALQEYTDEIMCQVAALLPPEARGVYADHPRLMELVQASSASQVCILNGN